MQAYIKTMQEKGHELVGVEVPYNYYGHHGFIDVLLRKKIPDRDEWIVSELKSHLDDIGEALRQVHRAKMYFFPATGRGTPTDAVFDLVVEARVENERIWRENKVLLSQVPIRWLTVEAEREAQEVLARIEVRQAIAAISNAHRKAIT